MLSTTYLGMSLSYISKVVPKVKVELALCPFPMHEERATIAARMAIILTEFFIIIY